MVTLNIKETKKFLAKVKEDLKIPLGLIPTPRVNKAIREIMTDAIKRRCIKCKSEIDKCMGFVLARDIVKRRKEPRELCGKCILTTEPDEIERILHGFGFCE